MKKIYCLLVITMMFVCTGCGASNQNQTKTTNQTNQVVTVQHDEVHVGSPRLNENINFILNQNYKLVGDSYYTKSSDFKNAYFIGALVEKNGQYYNCIWFANTPDMTGDTNSANDHAVEASGMPDARKFSSPISMYDDGYSRVNGPLLKKIE